MFIAFVENILIMGTCLNYFKNKYKQSIGVLKQNKKKLLLLVLSHKIYVWWSLNNIGLMV